MYETISITEDNFSDKSSKKVYNNSQKHQFVHVDRD
jgi:hypothetical protein